MRLATPQQNVLPVTPRLFLHGKTFQESYMGYNSTYYQQPCHHILMNQWYFFLQLEDFF